MRSSAFGYQTINASFAKRFRDSSPLCDHCPVSKSTARKEPQVQRIRQSELPPHHLSDLPQPDRPETAATLSQILTRVLSDRLAREQRYKLIAARFACDLVSIRSPKFDQTLRKVTIPNNMDGSVPHDAPDQIVPETAPKRSFGDRMRAVVRKCTTK